MASGFRLVAALGFDGVGGFGIGVVSEVFGYDRSAMGVPRFEFSLCAQQPGPVRMDNGLTIIAEHDLSRLVEADVVQVTCWSTNPIVEPPAEVLEALRVAYDRGAILVSQCTGAYVLCATGLLDGKQITTHWRYAADIAARFPDVTVDDCALYVDAGRIITGAGVAAGVDTCLYLVRREHGATVANAIARDMVVPPHRDGGQAQYVATPVPDDCDDERLTDVIGWARANLHESLTVDRLASRALMSSRSFARNFRAATGTTPRAWLLAQRIQRAELLLEEADLSVEEIAHRVGFGTAAALREQFVRRRGVPPRDYRRTFRAVTP